MSEKNLKEIVKSQLHHKGIAFSRLILWSAFTIISSQMLHANAANLRDGTSITKFNYPAVCVFTDFVSELIPPIDARLVRSKNTKK